MLRDEPSLNCPGFQMPSLFFICLSLLCFTFCSTTVPCFAPPIMCSYFHLFSTAAWGETKPENLRIIWLIILQSWHEEERWATECIVYFVLVKIVIGFFLGWKEKIQSWINGEAWRWRELTKHLNSLQLPEWQLIMSSQTCDLWELIREGGM